MIATVLGFDFIHGIEPLNKAGSSSEPVFDQRLSHASNWQILILAHSGAIDAREQVVSAAPAIGAMTITDRTPVTAQSCARGF
jgi:hypothetical protein